jgi:hypothetical protein
MTWCVYKIVILVIMLTTYLCGYSLAVHSITVHTKDKKLIKLAFHCSSNSRKTLVVLVLRLRVFVSSEKF